MKLPTIISGLLVIFIQDNMPTIQKGAGVLLIVLGLNMIGVLRIPFLYRTYQFEFPGGGETR